MPIKRCSKGTGYTKRHSTRVTNPTHEEFEELAQQLVGDHSFEGRIRGYEEYCEGVLREAGYRTDFRSAKFNQIPSQVEFQCDVWYAYQVLNLIRLIRAIRKRADKREEDGLFDFILDLGSHIKEWKIKRLMREAASYRTESKNQVQNGEARRQAFEAARKRGLGTMAAYRAAAKELGMTKKNSWKTIQRAVKDKSD